MTTNTLRRSTLPGTYVPEWERQAARRYSSMITPEMLEGSPALRARLAAAAREVAPPAHGITAARRAEIESSSLLTSDHWLAIRVALMRENGVMAVWFIDSVDLFLHAHGNWPKPSGVGAWYPSLVLFDTKTANAKDWLLAPWFASFRGVWAELSDGQHIHFVPKRSIADAEI